MTYKLHKFPCPDCSTQMQEDDGWFSDAWGIWLALWRCPGCGLELDIDTTNGEVSYGEAL